MIYTKESDCAWHYRDTLSETFTFLSYFRGLLRGVWDTRETAAHLPLAPFSFLSSGTESRAHSGRGARPSSASMRPLSSSRTSPACRASPWQLRASSAPPYPRPPSCGPEAGRAGGLWEEAVSDGAASARDGEAAVGPEPEVGGVRGRVRAGARGGAGRPDSDRRRSASRAFAEKAAAEGRRRLAVLRVSAEPPAPASSPSCPPLPHQPVLFYFEALSARGGFWESLKPRWDPAVLAHGLLGFVVTPVQDGSTSRGWWGVLWGLCGPSQWLLGRGHRPELLGLVGLRAVRREVIEDQDPARCSTAFLLVPRAWCSTK